MYMRIYMLRSLADLGAASSPAQHKWGRWQCKLGERKNGCREAD